ncbi:MAG: hypothetical protein DHS20C14_14310 [Phycisphaeraceae bacterium]|nr:MAG: hypothetical protein DHS20C14_14310 [Phycisphaeraceae bacterium]
MSEREIDPRDKLRFEHAEQARQFEIDLLWRRSAGFWVFVSIAFAGYGAAVHTAFNISETGQMTISSQLGFIAALVVSIFGYAASMSWYLINRGSRYWQRRWEREVEAAARNIWGEDHFLRSTNLDPGAGIDRLTGATRFSPSRVLIGFSAFVMYCWMCLLGVSVWAWVMLLSDRMSGVSALAGGVAIVLAMGAYLLAAWAAKRRKD